MRPFCVYGPGENPEVALVEVSRYLRWHLNGKPIHVVGDPDRKTRDFVHVSDVIRGLIILAEHGTTGTIYNLGSGEEVTMRQLTDAIGVITDRTTTVQPILQMTEDSYRLVSDISKARSHGYAPRVSLDAGVETACAALGGRTPRCRAVRRSLGRVNRADRREQVFMIRDVHIYDLESAS